ncbi:hypothetical protein [Streptomyces sp. 769]|uniref:hypothetical protein n=1 Tax=Streptomyces sp. 769 TaxID=1262452 RepID=UPI0005821F4F|nr:hypothetical protein [Streptomyces sp. 769]AJC61802.1 hypothetical protein GZL_09281 [Streptomyces sp. 769]
MIAPQQQAVLEAEAAVQELAARSERNAEHLRELAELIDLRDELPHLERDKEAAEAAYTAARQDTDQTVKQGTDRWSNHLLRRMQACDPEITTVSISPEDSSVPLNGSPFDAGAVVGHGMTRTNVSTWLALRDTAREVSAMPVPQFLIVDSPFTGLGSSTEEADRDSSAQQPHRPGHLGATGGHGRTGHHRLHRTARHSWAGRSRNPHQLGRRRRPRPATATVHHYVRAARTDAGCLDAGPASTRRGLRGQRPHPGPLTRGRRLLPDGSRAPLQYQFLIRDR